MSDPFDLFSNPSIAIKDFPGNTKPRNRGGAKEPAPLPTDRLSLLNSLKAKEYSIKGVDTKCYDIGDIAKVLGKKPVTIRSWESKGWMPAPKLRTRPPQGEHFTGKPPKGRRLYTRNQVEYLVHAFEQSNLDDLRHADWENFRLMLKNYPTL